MPPRFVHGPTTRLVHIGADGTRTDLTSVLATDVAGHPERGVPYSVSWYEGDGRYQRRERVYLERIEQDPVVFVVIDTLTGQAHRLPSASMPLFRAPTAAAPFVWR